MKNLTILTFVLLLSGVLFARQPGKEFYQLKVYTLVSEAQEATVDKYLKDAYLPALHRADIKTVGVFKNIKTATDTTRKIYVLIPFKSLNQFATIDATLAGDKKYLTAGSDYIDAAWDKAPFARIESTLLQAFSGMPVMDTPDLKGPRKNRVYELRSYESATEKLYVNKVEMFNVGEVTLFDKLGFNAVFYGEVLSGSKMPNLMYMTTFDDMASRDAHWDAFRVAPEWKELSSMPKYQKNVSKADIMLLYPTEYSDY